MSGTGRSVRAALCLGGLSLAAALQPDAALASPEIDRLTGLASQGDRAALDSLVEIARRKKDADAEYALGLMAYEGRGLERNTKQAFQLIERAASKGHAEAHHILGYFHENGIGTRVDIVQALASYRRGAEAGSARARTNLGWFYEHGIGVGADPAQAAQWYAKAAEQGLPAAQANLAHLYESGLGVSKNPQAAIALYEIAIAGGVVSAELRLGRLMEALGDLRAATDHYAAAAKAKVPEADLAAGRLFVAEKNPGRNLEQGIYWLEQAAAQDRIEAILLLATLYDKGGVGAADPRRAAIYFQRAAILGDAESAFRYAGFLDAEVRAGSGADPIPWFRRAAEKGHVEAQFQLGRRLEERAKGDDTRKEAVEWYRKAATQGQMLAALRLAMALESGQGTDRAPAEAIDWYLKAAEVNDPEALFRLGNLYDQGIGTQADFRRARDYYSRAATLGHAEAARVLQRIAGVPALRDIQDDQFKGMR